ncbi:MAG TPA: branched-chain amino acid aminotransferase [Bryobacteraceae bacterium]|jgi:branched-chain amino acid aminotransferase|nr:branched-chain amino acid aminotransferase [Bryobacteraceae bacterium]
MATLDIQVAPQHASAAGVDLDPARLEFGKTFAPDWFVSEYRNGHWQNSRVEPLHNISLHPAAIVFHYGQSIFEGMKAYRWPNGKVALFRPLDNARRFARSAERMAMPPVDPEFFVEAIKALVRADIDWIPREPGSLYIRPTMMGTETAIGVHASNEFLFFVLVLPSGAYFKETGPSATGTVTVYVAETSSRAATGGTGDVKASANYAISLHTIEEGKKQHCSQVLFLDSNGHREVEELGGMNVFFVEKKTLYTPPLQGTILPGITRDSVIRVARDLGLKVEETPVQIDEAADKIRDGRVTEVFACGTAAVVVGIKELVFETGRRLIIGDGTSGEITRKLNSELQGIQFGRIADRHGWIELL